MRKKQRLDDCLFYSLLVVAVLMALSAVYPGFVSAVKSQWVLGLFSLFFFSAAFIHSWMHNGRKFTLIFFAVMVLYSFSAEYAGTHYGLYYTMGEKPLLFEGKTYYYADFLPLHVFKVPVVLILMWPFIIYSAFFISQGLSKRVFGKVLIAPSILLASVFAMLWDVAFDPLATKLGFWYWVGGGSAFSWIAGGIPVGNFTSWFFITFFSLLISALLMRAFREKMHMSFDRTGILLSLFLFLFIWTFAIATKEYLFLAIGVATQLVPWLVILRSYN